MRLHGCKEWREKEEFQLYGPWGKITFPLSNHTVSQSEVYRGVPIEIRWISRVCQNW